MRYLELAEINALQAGTVVAREFVTMTVKDRITGDPEPIGFWSDAGPFSGDIINALTGDTETWSFVGDALASVGDIALVSDLSVTTVEITLSGIDATVLEAVRTYDVRNAPVQVSRGFFDPVSRALIAPAKARFIGFVDEAPLTTPAEGNASTVVLSCASHARELTRKNPDVRSYESQIIRAPGDDFYRDTSVVSDWQIFWGQKAGKLNEQT